MLCDGVFWLVESLSEGGEERASLVAQRLGLQASNAGACAPALVGELGSRRLPKRNSKQPEAKKTEESPPRGGRRGLGTRPGRSLCRGKSSDGRGRRQSPRRLAVSLLARWTQAGPLTTDHHPHQRENGAASFTRPVARKHCHLMRQTPSTSVKGARSCPTLCNPMDYTVHGILRPEHWSGEPFPSPGGLPNPGIEPRSPALRADSLPAEPPGMPIASGSSRPRD